MFPGLVQGQNHREEALTNETTHYIECLALPSSNPIYLIFLLLNRTNPNNYDYFLQGAKDVLLSSFFPHGMTIHNYKMFSKRVNKNTPKKIQSRDILYNSYFFNHRVHRSQVLPLVSTACLLSYKQCTYYHVQPD